jgi:hypothetical protein
MGGAGPGLELPYAGQLTAIWQIGRPLGTCRAAAWARPAAASHRLDAPGPVSTSAINGKAMQMRRKADASTEAVSSWLYLPGTGTGQRGGALPDAV